MPLLECFGIEAFQKRLESSKPVSTSPVDSQEMVQGDPYGPRDVGLKRFFAREGDDSTADPERGRSGLFKSSACSCTWTAGSGWDEAASAASCGDASTAVTPFAPSVRSLRISSSMDSAGGTACFQRSRSSWTDKEGRDSRSL